MPRCGLWEMIVEKSEKIEVAEVMPSGKGVRHLICTAGKMRDFMVVAMVPLVEAGQSA